MIANDNECRITRRQLEHFEQALAEMATRPADEDAIIPEALRRSLAGEAQHLRDDLSQYEALRDGRQRHIPFTSLEGLVEALAAARTVARLTQEELGERLGLSQQQIQRYEAQRFRGASHERLQEVIDALSVEIRGMVTLPSVSAESMSPPVSLSQRQPSRKSDETPRPGTTVENLGEG